MNRRRAAMSPTLEPNATDASTLRRDVPRHRLGPRDLRQFGYLIVAFVLVVFLGLYAFALVFNEVTI
jgi:hypothetical protein